MITDKQEGDFKQHMMLNNPLSRAISWISYWIKPEQVYTEAQIIEALRRIHGTPIMEKAA